MKGACPFLRIRFIEVDGKAVDKDCYTAESGSTVITLKAGYLETLAADDGDEDVVAQTGDSADITPWIALILVSGISAEQETAADGYPHYQKAERRPDTEDNRTDIQKTQYH